MNNDIDIELSREEIITGAMVGVMRQIEMILGNKENQHGAKANTSWQRWIEGSLGELAAAKYLDLYWEPKTFYSTGDVGPYEIRTADSHKKRLILHPSDPDAAPFILLTGVNGKYKVRGWIYGRDGKQGQYWTDPPKQNRPAFFVPKRNLYDIGSLPTLDDIFPW